MKPNCSNTSTGLSGWNSASSIMKKGERQKHVHRLITRGATVESIVPEVGGHGEAEFYQLAGHIFFLPEVKALLLWEGM